MSARPLKVALVYQDAYDDWASPIANEMRSMADLTVLTNTGAKLLDPSVTSYKVRHLGTRMFNPSYVIESFRIARKLIRLRPDVIHVQHFYPFLSYFFITRSRPPLVLTLHESQPHNRHGGIYGALAVLTLWKVFFLASAMMRKSERIIVPSISSKEELERNAPGNSMKIDVIPLPILPVARSNQGLDNRTVLFFGNMLRARGLDILLKAMLSVKSDLKHARLLVAGGGRISSEDSGLLEECKKHFEVEVKNYFIPREEVERLFSESSFVVLPYRIPTSSGVLNTAYSFCKPVIASRMGYFEEMVVDGVTGFLFDINNPASLAQLIQTLLNNARLRNKMEDNIYEFRKQYLPEKIASMHVASYRRAVSHT